MRSSFEVGGVVVAGKFRWVDAQNPGKGQMPLPRRLRGIVSTFQASTLSEIDMSNIGT